MIMATKYNDFNIHADPEKFSGGSMFAGEGGGWGSDAYVR